jgi:acyl-CoA reductase-like NAD-dependent aldehyde dehydrogenase
MKKILGIIAQGDEGARYKARLRRPPPQGGPAVRRVFPRANTSSTAKNNDTVQARREIFGPVVSAIPFDDEAEVIRLANDTEDVRPRGLRLVQERRQGQ